MIEQARVLFCGAVLMVGLADRATATTLVRMSVARLSQRAPVIVRARCLANSTGWDGGEIWTLTSFEVDEDWKGTAPARIAVRLLGGRVGNLTSSVAGVPRFHAGEEVVLFLEPTARGEFTVVSWEQGTFRIHREMAGDEGVTQDSASFETLDAKTHRFAAAGIRNMPVGTFHARVDAALSAEARSRQ